MTTSHWLYQNTGTNVWALSDTLSDAYTQGTAFASTSGGFIVALLWYRPNSSTSWPSSLKLWDTQNASSPIATVTSGLSGTGTGWREFPIDAVELVPGREYRVTAYWPSGSRAPYTAKANRVAAPSPLVFSDYAKYYNQNAGDTYPTTTDNVNCVSVDVGWNDDATEWAGSGQAGSGATTNQDLASWLSASGDVNSHQDDGLPWLIKAEIAATKALVELIPAAGDTNWTKVTDIWKFARHLTDAEYAVIHAFFDQGSARLTGTTSAGGSAFTNIATKVDELATAVATAVDPAARLKTRPPATGWELTAETDFTFDLSWDEPADIYVLHVTEPAGVLLKDFAGANMYYRLGSWAPLNGSHVAGPRGFLEYEFQELDRLPARMQGLILKTQVGVEGHVQAYTYATG